MIQEIMIKLIAKPLAGAKTAWHVVAAATASVCETMLLACKSTFASDVGRIKEALVKRLEAKTAVEQAEAQKKLVEAAAAANAITPRSHSDKLAKLEEERQQIENRKRAAQAAAEEAKADKAKAEAARVKLRAYQESLVSARERHIREYNLKEGNLFDALRQLQQEGGMLHVNVTELEKLASSLKRRIEDKGQEPH